MKTTLREQEIRRTAVYARYESDDGMVKFENTFDKNTEAVAFADRETYCKQEIQKYEESIEGQLLARLKHRGVLKEIPRVTGSEDQGKEFTEATARAFLFEFFTSCGCNSSHAFLFKPEDSDDIKAIVEAISHHNHTPLMFRESYKSALYRVEDIRVRHTYVVSFDEDGSDWCIMYDMALIIKSLKESCKLLSLID